MANRWACELRGAWESTFSLFWAPSHTFAWLHFPGGERPREGRPRVPAGDLPTVPCWAGSPGAGLHPRWPQWGPPPSHTQVACVAVTAAMHLLFLVAFSWMLVEGLLLWSSVVAVSLRPGPRMTLCYAAGWGEAPLRPTPAPSSTPHCVAPLPPTAVPHSAPPNTHLHLAPSTTQHPALLASSPHL